jgi:predicted MFS family arabinose efflux permease
VIGGLLRRGDFRTLLVGQAVSGFGDWMATVALMALVLEITGSSTAVGGVLVLRLAPAAIAGPVSTRFVRRWNPRRTMLAMDLGRAVVVLLLALVWSLWWAYLWAFVLEVGGLVFLPARDGVVPDIVDESVLPLANGLVLGSSYGTMPIGAGAFAAVSVVLGGSHLAIRAVFVIDAVTFLVSWWCIRRIRSIDTGPFDGADTGDGAAAPEGPDTPFLEAFHIPDVRAILPATVVVAVGLGALFSLGIVFVRTVLGASNTAFSILIALFGVGAAVGLGVLRLLGSRGMRAIRWSVALQGAVVAAMSWSPAIGFAYLGALGFGATTAATLTLAMSELQDRLADQRRVQAFAVFHVVVRAGLAIAAIGAGVAGDLLREVTWPLVGSVAPARLVLFVSGLVVIAGAALTRDADSHPVPAAGVGIGPHAGQRRSPERQQPERQHPGDRGPSGGADTGEPGDERGLDRPERARRGADGRDRRRAQVHDDDLEHVGTGAERGEAGGERERVGQGHTRRSAEQHRRLRRAAEYDAQAAQRTLRRLDESAPDR